MADAATLLNRLGVPRYEYLTLSAYQSLEALDPNTLYFIKGTSLIYKGSAPYGSGIQVVAVLPVTEAAVPDMQYFVTDGDEAGIYVLNTARDGFNNITVTRKFVNEQVAELINDVVYDGETGELVFNRPGGEATVINLPKDNFLSAADFNADANVLTLTLSNNTTFDVPLSELMNVYAGGTTGSATVSVSESGEITAEVTVSPEDGNALSVRDSGLYVKETPIAAVLDDNATDEQAVSARLMYDILSAMAWKITA